LLFPEALYRAPLPKAKALVAAPFATFQGKLRVQGRDIDVGAWIGSQNHNWGSRHTDRYAWGQVAGFDDAPDVFLECATARIRVGKLYTPALSPLVLRIDGEELAFNGLWGALRARAHYEPFSWQLSARNERASVEVRFDAGAQDFIALPYDNPPGGQKICLNSKLAGCEVRLTRRGEPTRLLRTKHRAAFEILQDEAVPSVAKLPA
jgi:hypothetical protein